MYPVYHITEEKGAKFGRGTTTSTNKKVLKKKKRQKIIKWFNGFHRKSERLNFISFGHN